MLQIRVLRARCFACRIVAIAALATAALLAASPASAHLIHTNGTWTILYMSRDYKSPNGYIYDCANRIGPVDPLNVIMYQYGEGNRMNSHIESETHWGYYPGSVPRADQVLCGDSDSSLGNYGAWTPKNFDDQEGHGCWSCNSRAHFRIWYAPHGHDSIVDKWSIIDSHHEDLVCCPSHKIDQSWETWESHIGSEMAANHNYWYDYYVRQGSQPVQGFTDDGMVSRVGGLHNGVY